MELVDASQRRIVGGSANTRLFSYDWASGFIAPFKKANIDVARDAIKAVSGKFHALGNNLFASPA